MLNITLFVPGLLDAEYEDDGRGPSLSTLELFLARSTQLVSQADSYGGMLCKLFQCPVEEGQDVPIAAIGRLMDGEKKPEGYWLRADPVHLHAGQKSLNLVDVNSLSLNQHDALALAACVRRSFAEQGWELEVPVPARWYVKLDRKPAIRTTEVFSVIGRDIQEYMPRGDDAGTWHRLMNEIQMQLHNADINQLRAERGELPVNSLWLWGSGRLPGLLERCWTRVYSDDSNIMGLSMLSNTPCLPLPDDAGELFQGEQTSAEILVVMSDFQTTMLQRRQARQRLIQFEKSWCSALLDGFKNGRLGRLTILARQKAFVLSRGRLRKFWRRARPFNSYLA